MLKVSKNLPSHGFGYYSDSYIAAWPAVHPNLCIKATNRPPGQLYLLFTCQRWPLLEIVVQKACVWRFRSPFPLSTSGPHGTSQKFESKRLALCPPHRAAEPTGNPVSLHSFVEPFQSFKSPRLEKKNVYKWCAIMVLFPLSACFVFLLSLLFKQNVELFGQMHLWNLAAESAQHS